MPRTAMKRTFVILCLSALAFAQSQSPSASDASIVDAAKQSRESAAPKAKKVYTNDDLPSDGDVNVVGKVPRGKHASGDPVRDQAALDRHWQSRIDQLKAHIADLQRQLDLAQKSLSYNTRRDPTKANPGYAGVKTRIDSLQQQIADAKDKLSQLQDEAHKAGADKAYD